MRSSCCADAQQREKYAGGVINHLSIDDGISFTAKSVDYNRENGSEGWLAASSIKYFMYAMVTLVYVMRRRLSSSNDVAHEK